MTGDPFSVFSAERIRIRTALIVCGLSIAVSPIQAVASDVFVSDVESLTKGAHRLTGTSESRDAFDHVSQRLVAMQPDSVITQEFPTVQLRVIRCELRLTGGNTLSLLPMRPNGIIPPVTPIGGLSGALIHAGDGSPEQFLDRSVEDAIVVLDYNSGNHWLRAFRLGARAVIFVRADLTEAWHSHVIEANVNLPRFYYDGPREDVLDGSSGVLHSEVVWEPVVGRNLFAFYRGRDPVFGQDREELVVLAAAVDTLGEVPELSQGARGAANVAGLLKLAGRFQAHRPRRHMLLAFLDAQAQGHVGARHFYRVLETSDADAKVEGRTASLESEQSFLDETWALASSAQPLEHASPARRQLLNRFRDRAAERAYDVADIMFDLRSERFDLKRTLRSNGEDTAARARLREIDAELKEGLQPQKDEWNDVRRALGKDRTGELEPSIGAKLDLLVADARDDIRLRLDEMISERRALESDLLLRDLLKDKWIALHASLLLGDTTPRWGLVIGGDSHLHSGDDNPGLYGKVQSVFMRAYDELASRGAAPGLFERGSADQSLSQTRVLWAAPYLVHSGEIAGMFGIYNLCFATCQESLAREGTPDDVPDHLDLERIEAQLDDVSRLLSGVADLDAGNPSVGAARSADETTDSSAPRPTGPSDAWAVANQEGLSLRRGIVASTDYSMPKFAGETMTGPMVMGLLPGNSIPNMPVAGAVVQILMRGPSSLGYRTLKPYAFQNFIVTRTTRNGTYEIGPVRRDWGIWSWMRGFAAVFDDRGAVRTVSDTDSTWALRTRLNVFRAHPGWSVLPPPMNITHSNVGSFRLLSARDNGSLSTKKSYLQVGDGMANWYAEEREEGIKLFHLNLTVALNSGPGMAATSPGDVDPLGTGFAMGKRWDASPASRRSALDLWRLNDSRLQLLQGKNIIDSSLAELHGRAEDLLLQTAGEPVTLHSEAIETSAFMASQPVYTKTRRMVDDLVFAVLILLGISVPFAFAIERIVIGATTIYRQMSWFAAIFIVTFVILFLTHPAFAIANTPVIIFLGFAILILSVLVISIIMRRFEAELKVLQGMPATVHAADVSRIGTLLAAMHMGISTMRRRPLKTALTAVTIILLTFTILSFASFGTQSGVVRLFAAPVPSYSGVFVHDVNWADLGADILDVIRGRWGKHADVYARWWISPRTENDAGLILTRPDGTRPLTIKGVLGLDPHEIRARPDLRRVLDESLEGAILLTPAVARALGVSEGDPVLLAGVPLRVGRLTDPVAISITGDMDGSRILPVDFTEARSGAANQKSLETALNAAINWISLPVDDVVVVSDQVAIRLGATLRAYSVHTAGNTQAAALAEEMARMLPLPVAGTLDNGVFRHILGTVVAASGTADLVFPILLGGLVIFGTMLGSVADREREIYTFSALGLAPRHVATLFVAEAIVYALIGGMGGYLLAQAVVRVLSVLASHGLVQVPEMNMSSTNTIVTILIVMATVLVSAIYPAIKASRSANPGLMRTWQPPAPVGNVMDMVFPFTVSDYDITGVVSFLKEHFDNHSDVGLGHFMASNTRIVRDDGGLLSVCAYLTLAPFDLGVSQNFVMRSTPSEIPGIDEVRIHMQRATGQPKDWQRLNRVLLDDLRQQFLIWRALPEETMEVYRQRTLASLADDRNGAEMP